MTNAAPPRPITRRRRARPAGAATRWAGAWWWLLAAAIGAAAAGCGRVSPVEVVRRSVADPVPRSLVVLHAQADRGLDVRLWSHFRVAPRDLAAILAAGPFTPPAPPDGLDLGHLHPPDWWDPSALGPGRTVARAEDHAGREAQWSKIFVVNARGDEVYAVQYYPY